MCKNMKAVERTDEGTPSNGELLDDDDGSTLIVSDDLGDVDGDLGASNTNTDTVQVATSDELTELLARDLYRGTYLFVLLT
jgi:hypothetical protein